MSVVRSPELKIVEAKEALRASMAEDPNDYPTGDAVRQLALAYMVNVPTKVSRHPYWLGESSRFGRGIFLRKVLSVAAVIPDGEQRIQLGLQVDTEHRTHPHVPNIEALTPFYWSLGPLVFDENEAIRSRESVNLAGRSGQLGSAAVFDQGSQRVSGFTAEWLLELPDDPPLIIPRT